MHKSAHAVWQTLSDSQSTARAPDLLEELAWAESCSVPVELIAGVDEVGRGCLAGPVTVGAVLLPTAGVEVPGWLTEVRDSKLLSPEKREELEPLIQGWVGAWAIGEASVAEIDQHNIYWATLLAMERALAALPAAKSALIDGISIPKAWKGRARAVVKGDLKCLSIAMASILAKTHRDRLMREAEVRHPGFGFGIHKGYFTPQHQAALKKLGPCALHRQSFAPVREALGMLSGDLFAAANASVQGDLPLA